MHVDLRPEVGTNVEPERRSPAVLPGVLLELIWGLVGFCLAQSWEVMEPKLPGVGVLYLGAAAMFVLVRISFGPELARKLPSLVARSGMFVALGITIGLGTNSWFQRERVPTTDYSQLHVLRDRELGAEMVRIADELFLLLEQIDRGRPPPPEPAYQERDGQWIYDQKQTRERHEQWISRARAFDREASLLWRRRYEPKLHALLVEIERRGLVDRTKYRRFDLDIPITNIIVLEMLVAELHSFGTKLAGSVEAS
jgi:hypothetical protein